MICVLTETCELAIKIAASLGGIEFQGMLLRQDMTAKQKKELTELLQRDSFLKGSIYEDSCIFIWFDGPVFCPYAPNEYAEYEKACQDRELFHPAARRFKIYDGMETVERTLRGFLTNRAKFSEVYAVCCHESAVAAFGRMYSQYGMKQTRFRLITLPESATSQDIRSALKKSNLISAPESNLEMMRRKTRDEIYWLISANLQLAVFLCSKETLPIGLKTLCLLGRVGPDSAQANLIDFLSSYEDGLFGTAKEIASLIKMLEKASLIKRKDDVLTLTEKGGKILSLCSNVPEVTDLRTVIDLERKLKHIAKSDLLEKADAVFQKAEEFYWKKTETWFHAILNTRLIEVPCPGCGRHYLSCSPSGYHCSCGFEVPKVVHQKELTEDVLAFLLENKKTPVYKGKDQKYSRLILTPALTILSSDETDLACPVCGRMLRITEDGNYLVCDCAFCINTVFYGHRLTKKEMTRLLTEKRTPIMTLGRKEKPWKGIITINSEAEIIPYRVED